MKVSPFLHLLRTWHFRPQAARPSLPYAQYKRFGVRYLEIIIEYCPLDANHLPSLILLVHAGQLAGFSRSCQYVFVTIFARI